MSKTANENTDTKNAERNAQDESVLMNVRLAKLGLKYENNSFGYRDDFSEVAPSWLMDDGCRYVKMIDAMIKKLVRAQRYEDAKNFVSLLEDIAQDYPQSIDAKQLKSWKEEAEAPITTGALILNIIIMLLVIVNLAMMVTMLFNNGQIPWMSGFLNSLG